MKINMNNGITVDLSYTAKKEKKDSSMYCIYISFQPYQHGVRQLRPYIFSTGISVKTGDWSKDKIVARGAIANQKNERLFEYFSKAKQLLDKLSTVNYKTCNEILYEIKENAKQHVVGKAAKHKHQMIISRLNEYTYEKIMDSLLIERNLAISRCRGYRRSYELLNQYFEGNLPHINLISDNDLTNFKRWFLKQHTGSENTATDYLSKVAAVFKYALESKILTANPLPPRFRGSWHESERPVITETECLAIIKLDDDSLSKTDQIAKYCLLVQILTGMGYGDMENLSYDNIKFDKEEQRGYIEKERNKTGVYFKVFSTSNAQQMIDKLIELTGDEKKPFNLPTLDYTNRRYKEIAKMADININVSSYTFRHSYSVIFLENDGRIEDLAKHLGHKDLRTTQIYGKVSNRRLAQKSRELESKSPIHQIHPTQKNLIAV